MSEREISSPEELDAVLIRSAMYKRENLVKIAEGRSFRWVDAIGFIAGYLAVLSGMYGVLVQKEMDAVFVLAIGIILVGFSWFRRQQVQIDALRKLIELR